jgi:phage repressor protein C with HTH and peptisase S24 domain
MAPRIPHGSVCLFGPARTPLEGRIVLLEHDAVVDSDVGGTYAVKKIGKVQRARDGRVQIVLRSLNPRFAPVVLWVAGDEELRVTAELIEVLAGA